MGRYKLGPQGGYYDPSDSGPDQFTPQPGQQYPGMPAPQQPQQPSMPSNSEGPGGFTGHAQDPNYWQLGQQQPAKHCLARMPSTSVDPGFNTERGGGMPSLGAANAGSTRWTDACYGADSPDFNFSTGQPDAKSVVIRRKGGFQAWVTSSLGAGKARLVWARCAQFDDAISLRDQEGVTDRNGRPDGRSR